MANLSTKTKYVNIVIRVNGYFPNMELIENWCKENCEDYYLILHKEDLNPTTGEILQPHAHMVLILNQAVRLSTTLSSLTNYLNIPRLGVEISKTSSFESSVQYLLHKNNKEKTQHKENEIITNINRDELKTILESKNNEISIDMIINYCKDSLMLTDVIKKVGLNYFNMYRNVILIIWEDMKNFKNGRILEMDLNNGKKNKNSNSIK